MSTPSPGGVGQTRGISPSFDVFIDILESLPPDVNPYLFLADAIDQLLATSQPRALVILLYICAALWPISFIASIASLVIRIRRGEKWLFRLKRTRLGPILIPNAGLIYPALQIGFAITTVYTIALLIKSSMDLPATRASYSLWKLNYVFMFLSGWTQAYSSITSAFVSKANRMQDTKYWVGKVATGIWIFFGITIPTVLMVFLIKLADYYPSFISALRNIETTDESLISTWSPGDGITLENRLALLEAFKATDKPADSITLWTLGFNFTLLAMIIIMFCVWIPAAYFQIRNLRLQLRLTKLIKAEEHKAQLNSPVSPVSSKGQFDPLLELKRLRLLCENVIMQTIGFVILAAGLIPIGGLLIYRLFNVPLADIHDFSVLQIVAMLLFTFVIIPIDVINFQRVLIQGRIQGRQAWRNRDDQQRNAEEQLEKPPPRLESSSTNTSASEKLPSTLTNQ